MTMKNALILIAFTLAIIAGTAAEAVEAHQAVLYTTTNHWWPAEECTASRPCFGARSCQD